MKKSWMFLVLAAIGMVSLGLTGCKKEEPASPEAAVKKAAEQPASTLPAEQKPKDHPAH